jgi:hypothetical protein
LQTPLEQWLGVDRRVGLAYFARAKTQRRNINHVNLMASFGGASSVRLRKRMTEMFAFWIWVPLYDHNVFERSFHDSTSK